MTAARRMRRSPQARSRARRRPALPSDPDGPGHAPLDLVTMVVACTQPPSAAAPEQAALLRLCTRPRAVAEISAHLRLPWTAVTLLLAELLAAGLVRVREPAIRSALPDPLLFDAVTQRLLEL